MLPARIDPAAAIQATCSGATFKATEVPDGLIERTVPRSDIRDAAAEWIRTHPQAHADRAARNGEPLGIQDANRSSVSESLAAVRHDLPDDDATRAVVECIEIGIQDGWTQAIAAERRLLTGLRHTPTARERLESFLARA